MSLPKVSVVLVGVIATFAGPRVDAAPTLKGRAVWASPRDAGTTEAATAGFHEHTARIGINWRMQ